MLNEGGLIAAYILDGKGKGIKIGWEEIRSWTPDKGILWVHLDYTSAEAQQWINQEAHLEEVPKGSLLEVETRPRCALYSDGLLLTLRGVNLLPLSDPEDMVAIRIWIEENRIISTRKRKLLSVEDLRNSIEKGSGPRTPAEFLVELSDRLVNRMADVIDQIDDSVDHLQDQVLTEESHQLRPIIAGCRRQAIALRRYLGPQREALSKLYNERVQWLEDVDRMRLREISDRMMRYIEDLDTSRERASVAQEELMSRLSENMEKRMYVISIVSVVFLPLSFITGLLGINVGGIPGSEDKTAFMMVCIFLIIMVAIQFWIFKIKKWL
ncbi:MAG: zinc transporter ZntB [Candidatus Nitrohelix vancouverensis]|uniref:Zinc transporter ZntB n=1 Tax=Candidatus Nitrohelix vancouverensis TaxID=2705534 RepID=A0A7T0G4R8_9BACT|nr:MAG: zinc transporter ZntB [Candidatus Nitrohelix vancouverensis]